MRTLHQTLHLQHHRHTGRRLHHQHTSYRGLLVVFVVAGAAIVSISAVNRAAADSFGISAWVNIPVPSMPPLISTPAVSTVVAGSSLLVTGSCPLVTPQVVVNISIDGAPAGTGACDRNNDFSVPVTMDGGNHQLVASSLTISGQKGPGSDPVSITSRAGAAQPGISISGSQPFMYADGRQVAWTGTVGANGTEYVHIDWGDSSQSSYTVQAGTQRFTHRYTADTPHNILLATANATGTSSTMQFASATFSTYTPPAPAATPLYGDKTVAGLYGLYITAVAVTGIVWLEAKHSARYATVPIA